MKKWIAAVLAALFAAGAVGAEVALGGSPEQVLDSAYGHIFSLEDEDRAVLYGKRSGDGPYYVDVRIAVYSASGALRAEAKPKTDYGFEPKIILLPFTDNGLSEVFYAAASGGSGAFGYYYVYAAEGESLAVRFDYGQFSAENVYHGALEDGYRAKLTNAHTGEIFRLDLLGKGPDYLNALYDSNGVLKAPVPVNVSGANTVAPYWNASAGVYQLFVYQRVTGLSSADAYGYMLTQQRLEGGAFRTFFTLAAGYGEA